MKTIETQGTTTTIHETKKGYVVETQTCWQGAYTDSKILVLFSEDLPPGLDLDANYNEFTSNAMAILRIVQEARKDEFAAKCCKVLRKGYLVR